MQKIVREDTETVPLRSRTKIEVACILWMHRREMHLRG